MIWNPTRKCKSAALEPDEPEPEVARAAKEVIKGRGKRGRKVVSREQHVTRSVLPIGNDVVCHMSAYIGRYVTKVYMYIEGHLLIKYT